MSQCTLGLTCCGLWPSVIDIVVVVVARPFRPGDKPIPHTTGRRVESLASARIMSRHYTCHARANTTRQMSARCWFVSGINGPTSRPVICWPSCTGSCVSSVTCGVGDEQPVAEERCGRGAVVTVTLLTHSPGVATGCCQLDTRDDDKDMTPWLRPDCPLAVQGRRILTRPVGTPDESATDDLTVPHRTSVDATARTRPAFTHN